MPRILVVDDDAHMREVLELLLASNDRHVDSVASGHVASPSTGTNAGRHSGLGFS
jgi:CheY-like chemotaxis protein